MYMHAQLSVAVTVCAAAASFSASAAPVQCGDVITTKRVLNADLSCTGFNPALTIQGPNGILNMNRHTLSCEGSGTDGIALEGTRAQLRNGTVTTCDEGVVLNGARHVVNRMTLAGNSVDGLFLETGSGHRITGSSALNNGEDGFCISGDGNNFLFQNRAVNNDVSGFDTNNTGDSDRYLRNTASGNGEEGFFVRDAGTLEKNTATQNDEEGFQIIGANNTLMGNIARSNLDDGIEASGSAQNNALTQNTASGNGSADLDGDGGFDLEDDNLDCDNNAWTNNSGLANQPCVQ